MVVTFAGYDIKVGTPVMSRDGKEVGSVKSTDADDLVVAVHGDDKPLVVSERGVAAFEPDFVRLAQSADWIQKGQWKIAPAAGVRTLGGYATEAPVPAGVAAPLAATAASGSTATATTTAPPLNGSTSISKTDDEDSVTGTPSAPAATVDISTKDATPAPAASSTSNNTAAANTAAATTEDEETSTAPTGTEQAHAVKIHAENLVAQKREVASGAVTVRKRVVVDDESLDVDVFEEKVKVTRRDLDHDADPEHVFEDSTFEIELLKEAIDVSTRVRVVGQVALDKHRVTRTEKVSGQVRREEVDVDQVEYPEVRKPGAK